MDFSSAKWIWTEERTGPNQYMLARQLFTARGGACALRISADSQYVAYVNGSMAAFGRGTRAG